MINYTQVITLKYPGAIAYPAASFNFTVETGPDPAALEVTLDEEGKLIIPDNSALPNLPRITYWEVPGHPTPPTISELEDYAALAVYHTARAVPLKAGAEAEVNEWSNQAVMTLKILEPELFYVAMVSNVAFRLMAWRELNRPHNLHQLDEIEYAVSYAEAQAYRESHAGRGDAEATMNAADLLALQEVKWNQMQQGFAAIVYKRRLALEKIKLAPPGENLEAELAAILAELSAEA